MTRRAFVKEAAEKFGNQCIVVAVDAKKVSQPGEPARWEIFTHGGRNPTGLDAVDYAREVVALGAGEILLTSMDRDGTKSGFDIALTRAIADAVPVPVIASGGVGNLDHLVEGIRDGHATAVLAASIFHFGEYTIRQAKEHMAKAGLPMRLGCLGENQLACPFARPLQRAFQPVVAPEQFAVAGDEGRRAENPEPLRFVGLLTQALLVVVGLRGVEHRRRIAASSPARISPITAASSIRRPSANSARNTARQKVSPQSSPSPTSATRAASRLFCGNGSGRRNGSARSAHSRSRSRHMWRPLAS